MHGQRVTCQRLRMRLLAVWITHVPDHPDLSAATFPLRRGRLRWPRAWDACETNEARKFQ